MSFAPAAFAILIAGDSSDRARWTAAFEGVGFQTVEAGKSDEALALLQSDARVDLLVAGLMRDDLDAKFVVDAVHLRPDLRIVMIVDTGYPLGIQGRGALLLEPVSAAELLDTAQALLSRTE